MKRLKWPLINFVQVVFHFIWTPFMITVALFTLIVTFNRWLPLMLAHWVWAPVILWNTRTKVQAQGLENVDFSKPHIFVMNHQSTLDIPVIFKVVPAPLRFVVKKELRPIPFLGWYCRAMGMIFVDRSDRERAIGSLNKAATTIQNGASIIAFPEGTRNADGVIRPFKKGVFVLAINSGVPVVPVAVEGSRLAMPKNTWRQRPATVKVKIGRPIATRGFTLKDRDRLIHTVRNKIIEMNLELGGKGGENRYTRHAA